MRESRSTPKGPRSRTLATFTAFDDEVVEKVLARAAAPPDPEDLRAAAIRAGAPLAVTPLDRSAREALRLLARGERLDPRVGALLLDALGVEQPVSDAARAAAQWVGASLREREEVIRELLGMADALPLSSSRNRVKLPQKVVSLHRLLTDARSPHAFGGALAVGFYGEPRMTLDLDVNVFLPVEHWERISETLAAANIEVESPPDRSGQAVLLWESNPIDLFFSHDRLHEEMRRAARRAPFADGTIPLVAPEHLVVRKAILNRKKDWLDIEQILVATDPLDLTEIGRWLDKMVGPKDERRARFGALSS